MDQWIICSHSSWISGLLRNYARSDVRMSSSVVSGSTIEV